MNKNSFTYTNGSGRPWKHFYEVEAQQRAPQFFVIGAAKAATTWLTVCLNEHPEIFIPRQEQHYFSWYYQMFCPLTNKYIRAFEQASPTQLVGEHSNTYLADPGVPARIADVLPNSRIVVCLRNPIYRAYSDYCMHLRLGRVDSVIDNWLHPSKTKWPSFLETGRYYSHLIRYLNYFDRSQVHIVIHDDLYEDPLNVFSELCAFLRVKDAIVPIDVKNRINTSTQGDISASFRRFLNGTVVGRCCAEFAKIMRVNATIRTLCSRKFRYPEMPLSLKRDLCSYYGPEIVELSRLVNRDLSSWLQCK